MAHEGMSMLATEDGGDSSAGHLLCDVEGRATRRESIPFTSSLHVPLPLRKEVRCFCRPLRAADMKAVLPSLSACLPPSPQAAPHKSHGPSLPHAWGHSNPAILHAPSCSTSSPTASACPQMIYSSPVASAAPLYSGGRAPEWLARSGRPGGGLD